MRLLSHRGVRVTAVLVIASWYSVTCAKGSAQPPVPGHTRIADVSAEGIREDGVPVKIVEAVIGDLAKRLEVDRSMVVVLRAEPIVWSNGALGCPKPGESYIQMIVEGYRVILRHEEENYCYHCDAKGRFLLCHEPNRSSAQEPIVAIEVAPKKSVFKNSVWNKPIIIKSSEYAAKYFSKKALNTLDKVVDFKKQFVLVFAWRGSGGDKLSYNVAESHPEQVFFSLRPGVTRDLRAHTNVYTLRSNVRWSVKGTYLDSDGLLDAWEFQHFWNLDQAGDDDFDNDGLDNLGEFEEDTNPRFPDSDFDGLSDGAEINTHNSNPNKPDSDNDGIPDGYEVNNGLNLLANDVAEDLDNDGVSNLVEYQYRTNSNDDSSFPLLTLNIHEAVELEWSTAPGVLYQIQESTDLQTWIDLGDRISGDGATLSASVSIIEESKNFYRIIVVE